MLVRLYYALYNIGFGQLKKASKQPNTEEVPIPCPIKWSHVNCSKMQDVVYTHIHKFLQIHKIVSILILTL